MNIPTSSGIFDGTEPETDNPIEWYEQIKKQTTSLYIDDRSMIFRETMEACQARLQKIVSKLESIKNEESVVSTDANKLADILDDVEKHHFKTGQYISEARKLFNQANDNTILTKMVDDIIESEFPERYAEFKKAENPSVDKSSLSAAETEIRDVMVDTQQDVTNNHCQLLLKEIRENNPYHTPTQNYELLKEQIFEEYLEENIDFNSLRNCLDQYEDRLKGQLHHLESSANPEQILEVYQSDTQQWLYDLTIDHEEICTMFDELNEHIPHLPQINDLRLMVDEDIQTNCPEFYQEYENHQRWLEKNQERLERQEKRITSREQDTGQSSLKGPER